MKKIFTILILILVYGCSGYEPIYSSKGFDFYINEIEISSDDKISQKLIKKLKPYRIAKNNKQRLDIKIDSVKQIRSIAKNAKGDDTTFEMIIGSRIKIVLINQPEIDITFEEKFSYNNQENKFDLKQYQKNIEENLINTILEKFFIRLRNL
jgi:hypothetical protein